MPLDSQELEHFISEVKAKVYHFTWDEEKKFRPWVGDGYHGLKYDTGERVHSEEYKRMCKIKNKLTPEQQVKFLSKLQKIKKWAEEKMHELNSEYDDSQASLNRVKDPTRMQKLYTSVFGKSNNAETFKKFHKLKADELMNQRFQLKGLIEDVKTLLEVYGSDKCEKISSGGKRKTRRKKSRKNRRKTNRRRSRS